MARPMGYSAIVGKRTWFAAGVGVLAAGIVYASREVMLPFVLGLVLAYVLTPVISRLEARRVPRAWGIIGVYSMFLAALGLAFRVAVPRVVAEGGALVRDFPQMLQALDVRLRGPLEETLQRAGLPKLSSAPDSFSRSFALEKLREHAAVGALGAFDIVKGVLMGGVRFVFVFTVTLMLSAYLMLTRERIVAFFRQFSAPSARPAFDRLMRRVDTGLGGVIRGQLMICAINGLLSTVGFAALGLRYWPVFGLIATVFSLIPVFGTIASSVPAVLVGLSQSPHMGLMVLVWIVVIHQLEANFLNPKVMGHAAQIHPVLVMFALLAGEHLFGVVGALLGVPTMSVVQSVFLHVRSEFFADEPPTMHGEVAPNGGSD